MSCALQSTFYLEQPNIKNSGYLVVKSPSRFLLVELTGTMPVPGRAVLSPCAPKCLCTSNRHTLIWRLAREHLEKRIVPLFLLGNMTTCLIPPDKKGPSPKKHCSPPAISDCVLVHLLCSMPCFCLWCSWLNSWLAFLGLCFVTR